jgi:Glycosyl hydrolases family 35
MVYLASTIGSFHFEQPWMMGEYWAGWYDAWGAKHAGTDGELEAKELDWMLGLGYSVNLYMFHGGTSFGFISADGISPSLEQSAGAGGCGASALHGNVWSGLRLHSLSHESDWAGCGPGGGRRFGGFLLPFIWITGWLAHSIAD